MQQTIKVAVIGGTGKAGSYLVKELLDQGYHVKVLVRRPESYPLSHPSLEIVTGDIIHYETARKLIGGSDVVISTLGQKKDEPLVSGVSTDHIIRAMNEFHIRRYIFVTGLSTDLPGDKKSPWVIEGSAFMRRTFPLVMADKDMAFTTLQTSDLDWTLVRLPFIIQTDDHARLAVDLTDCPGDHINTTDLAEFLVRQISDKEYIRLAPFIASI
jgi:putative NADH-flavin reductase